MKRYVVMLAVMALLLVALAVPAFAAPQLPLPGQTERGPDQARSICSYSGLNDFEEGPGPLTQSYGQEVRGPDAAKPSEGPGNSILPACCATRRRDESYGSCPFFSPYSPNLVEGAFSEVVSRE